MGLQQNLKTDRVGDLNIREPVTVAPSASVRQTVEQMRAARLGCAIVIDEAGTAVGLFTEAMLRREMHHGPGILDEPVSGHMAETFPWVTPDDSVETVLDAMEARNTRFIVVLDTDRRVVGLTGQKGLMEYVAEHFPREVMVQYVGASTPAQKREGA